MTRPGELLALIDERGETRPCRFGLLAGWDRDGRGLRTVALHGPRYVAVLPAAAVSSSSFGLSPLQAARTTQKTTAPMWIHCLIVSPIALTVSATSVGRVAFVSSH
mgnify:CR=1 FL=1